MDKFGRSFSSSAVNSNRKNIKIVHVNTSNALSYGENGQYDAENRTIYNLREPIYENDATTKTYVDSKLAELDQSLHLINEHINDMDDKLYAITLEQMPAIQQQITDSSQHVTDLLKNWSESINVLEMKNENLIRQLKDKKLL
ncbi:hypothetical protein ABEB36_010809 [Hypothenemus hampei]|uniref:Uncharacterized protein n=1 Tax=Hypothenemus hampei TaxID=57062 RepID=A0ABD1ED72_HYPHA